MEMHHLGFRSKPGEAHRLTHSIICPDTPS